MPSTRRRCSWASGSTIHGKYELLRRVGSGASSAVYAAREHGTNRVLALKRVAAASRLTPSALDRVHREIRRIQEMQHPGIVPIHEFLVEGEEGVIITEFAPGQSLADRLRQRGALSVGEVVNLGLALAGTLSVAHDAGIVHRDIKPANVMLGQLSGPRLTDFSGTSPGPRGARPSPGSERPSPHFAAPERRPGRRGDPREDVYGLGLTLYIALVNELPRGVASDDPPSPSRDGFHPSQSSAGSAIPRWLDEVIARATAARPRTRYSDGRAFLQALESLRTRENIVRDRASEWSRLPSLARSTTWSLSETSLVLTA